MKLKDERLEVVRLMLGLGGYDAGQAYRATQALETIDAEIAALKAEVERLTCLAPQNVNLMIENHDLRKELEIMNHFYCNDNCELDNPPVFHVDRCLRIQALLAAKRDEGKEE